MSGAVHETGPEPESELASGLVASANSGYLYDLGCGGGGIRIRELAPADTAGLSGAPSGGRERCYKERALDDITGLSVWASAVMLGRWAVENGSQLLVGKHCLELGAGTGLSGLAAAAAMTMETNNGKCAGMDGGCAGWLHLTDFAAETMENLRYNLSANLERAGNVAGGDGSGKTPEPLQEQSWVSPGGCKVSLSRMDWDDAATWPRDPAPGTQDENCGEPAAAAAGGGGGGTFMPLIHFNSPHAIDYHEAVTQGTRRQSCHSSNSTSC